MLVGMIHTIFKSQSTQPQTLGLRANWQQFTLLIVINAFVGGMVGLERSVLPLLGNELFGLVSQTVVVAFLISFGLVKAITNLFAGRLSDQYGRKRILIIGWLFGLPVPFLLMWAPTWNWIILANVLLGINQGLCWSTTVIMKIDLAGPKQRGLAMGLNEFAGYLAVAGMALLSGYLAAVYGLRPYPFLPGIIIVFAGLLLSLLFAQETRRLTQIESGSETNEASLPFRDLLLRSMGRDRALFTLSQAGLVNNLNDALVWGLIPFYLATKGVSIATIGQIAAIYPAVWGLGQLATGAWSDKIGRKIFIVLGLLIQAGGIFLFIAPGGLLTWRISAVLMGLGTAAVYPTLLAAVSDVSAPSWRGSAIGVYRLWRDLGYAVGGLLTGLLVDSFGGETAVIAVGTITFISGTIVAFLLPERRPLHLPKGQSDHTHT